jgi:DNA-binding PadR family transcriptional regulator
MVLYKLENDGYVKTEWREVQHRQRKYYTITSRGREALEKAVKYLKEKTLKLQG